MSPVKGETDIPGVRFHTHSQVPIDGKKTLLDGEIVHFGKRLPLRGAVLETASGAIDLVMSLADQRHRSGLNCSLSVDHIHHSATLHTAIPSDKYQPPRRVDRSTGDLLRRPRRTHGPVSRRKSYSF